MSKKIFTQIALILVLFLSLASFNVKGQATVRTDLDDYPPGATAIITGSGFQPGEIVELHVEHAEGDPLGIDPQYHTPWYDTADATGNFTTSWYVPTDGDALGATFLLTADGKISGRHAEWTFTDAANFKTISVAPQSTNLIYGAGGSTNSIVTVGFTGSGASVDVTLSYAFDLGTPSGVTTPNNSHFITNPVSSTGSVINSTLSITSGNTTPVGSYIYTVTGVDNQSSPTTKTGKGTLVINKASTSISAVSGSGIYGGSVTLTATSNLNVAGLPITFSLDGSPSVGSANTNASGVATLIVPFASIPNSVRNAGAYINKVSASIANTSNYTAANGIGNLTINKADQIITWSNPADITYGTLLSGTQLNGTVAGSATVGATLPGALTYLPVLGTLLNAGPAQDLTVDAAATSNYNAATITVKINVNKADQIITWSNPADITYGTLLSGTQLNATVAGSATIGATTPGALTYLPVLGTLLNAGPAQDLQVDAAATSNYNAATKTVKINVNKADQIITWSNPADITYGTLLSGTQLNATVAGSATIGATAPGALTYLPVSGTLLNAGPAQNLQVDAAGTSNYNAATKTVQINVNKAILNATADNKSKFCGQVNPALTITITGYVNDETIAVLDVLPTASTIANNNSTAGTYDITALGGSDNNYSYNYTIGTLTINSVSIDASASSAPLAVGAIATLKATVYPNVAGVQVSFYLDGVLKNLVPVLTDNFGIATLNVSNLSTEVYQVKAVAGNGCSESFAYLAVYDPNGGFITGGGWIMSPAGAYVAAPSLTGKANFGFVAKYKKGSTQVDGNTEFQFHAGDLNFKSISHDAMSLVIAGAQAIYKGVGTINGQAGYSFMVSAIDGNLKSTPVADKFRIKIWNTATSAAVYDNQLGAADNLDATTALGGGSIVIHEVKKGSASREAIVTSQPQPVQLFLAFNVKVLNNPTTTSFKLKLESNDINKEITVKVVDESGRRMEVKENLLAGQVVEIGTQYRSGIYFAEVTQGMERKVVRLVKVN